jgi:GR25 family glycosyltransferase involved in LPS biosynthesis
MKKRSDREPYVQALQKRFPVKIYDPPSSLNGQQGCYESHQQVMRLSLDNEVAVIFEDDAKEIDDSLPILEECKKVLNSSSVDIIYLGCFPDIIKHFHTPYSGSLYNVKATQTHAYVVHQRFMQKFIATKYTSVPVDEYFRDNATCLAWLPGVFVQENSASNVSTVQYLSLLPYKNHLVYAAQIYASKVGIPLYIVCVSLILIGIAIRIKYGGRKTR